MQAGEEAKVEAENLKTQIANLDTKLEKLLNLYLADALSTDEYAAKKNTLMNQKATANDKINEIEKRGVSWLEPAREFVKSLNQAANLLSRNDLSGMTAFLKNIGANHSLRNRQFEFEAKPQYARAAAQGAGASSTLQFPTWCSRQESNLHHILRKDASYPLNDGS